jgi:hypothetical protein
MCRGRFRQWGRRGGRALFPETLPPPLNHAVVTGKLLGDPRPGWGPSEEPVTLLEVEFPVAHPEHPRFLWAYATYDVEVPGDVGGREVEEMRKGTPLMVAGQLSERLSIEDGRTSRHPVLVAALLHAGPPEGDGPSVPPPPCEAA